MNTILVVDDDSEIRDIIHVYLRNEGYSIIEAANGKKPCKHWNIQAPYTL